MEAEQCGSPTATLVKVQGNKMLGGAVFQVFLGPYWWGRVSPEVPCVPWNVGGRSEESGRQEWFPGGADCTRVNTGSRRKEMCLPLMSLRACV